MPFTMCSSTHLTTSAANKNSNLIKTEKRLTNLKNMHHVFGTIGCSKYCKLFGWKI